MNVAIIGCGLIGKKRFEALMEHKLLYAVDTDINRAKSLAPKNPEVKCITDYKEALADKNVDIVIIATTNENLAPIALEAVKAKKHVIVEKPAGRFARELVPIIEAAEQKKVFVKVGFNHRYHYALQKAKEIVDSGAIGEMMFIRGRYGHGGRVGYEKEWRADYSKSGGGELIDQGVHLIDLSRWFMGDFKTIEGFAHTYFWNMPVDDNGFMLLRTAKEQTAFLHVSCTEWKNMFSFEIYCKTGKLIIEGLGGSYGLERLYYYKMLPEMGPPETTIYEYPFPDPSWKLEFNIFIKAIKENRQPDGNIYDAKACLEVVEEIYRRSKKP